MTFFVLGSTLLGMAITWPADAKDPSYEPTVLAAVQAGQFEVSFTPIQNSWNGHSATFYVTTDAVKIDGFRPGMGARLMQQVADLLGCTLLTGRLSDLAYAQAAVKLTPITLGMMGGLTTNDMMKISTMRKESQMLDAALAKANYAGGLVFGPAKPWLIDNQLPKYPGKAENYGQYVPQAPGTNWLGVSVASTVSKLPNVGVIQGYWWPPFHTLDQNDYSEMAWLFHRYCIVDGQPRDTLDVMVDPELCGLMTHDGKPLTVGRQPGVAPYGCTPVNSKVGPMCPMPTMPVGAEPVEGLTIAQKVLLGIGGLVLAFGTFELVKHLRWLRG